MLKPSYISASSTAAIFWINPETADRLDQPCRSGSPTGASTAWIFEEAVSGDC